MSLKLVVVVSLVFVVSAYANGYDVDPTEDRDFSLLKTISPIPEGIKDE